MTDFFSRKTVRWALLLAFAALMFGLNLGEPGLYAVQEARAGIVARNMIRSGNYGSVELKGAHTTEKPVFYYWLTAASCKLFGFNETAVRLPSVLAALVSVVFACLLASRVYGETTGFLAGYMLSSMLAFVNLGRIARIDMALCAFFAASMFFLYLGWFERRRARTPFLILFYLCLAASVLVKGPVTVVFAGLTVLLCAVKERSPRMIWEMRPFTGLAIGLAVTMPWYVYESFRTGGEFAVDFFWRQNIDRFLGVNTEYCEGQRKTFFFYFPNLFTGALPWSLFIPPALWFFRKRLLALDSRTYFLFFWVAAVFLFLSFSCIKRGDYILPLYPALAALCARCVTWLDETRKPVAPWCWMSVWGAVLGAGLLGFAALLSGLLERFAESAVPGETPFIGVRDAISALQICAILRANLPALVIVFLLVAGFLFYCGKMFESGRSLRAAFCVAAAGLVLNSAFVMWFQPATDQYKSLKDFALACRKHIPAGEKVVYYQNWIEENIFYLDRDYERAWEMGELIDISGEKHRLKFNYIITPAESYDKMESTVKSRVVVAEKTVSGHQYPMVLCIPE